MARRRDYAFGLQNDFSIKANTIAYTTFILRGIIEADAIDRCRFMPFTTHYFHTTGLQRQTNATPKPTTFSLKVHSIWTPHLPWLE
jgi:hypothetical protein